MGDKTFDNTNKSMAFELFKGMQDDNLEYTYRGSFTSTITDTILTLAESNIENAQTQKKIKKRVYFIMVEGLQNITRHQSENESEELTDYPGLFAIQRKETGYYITTGNLIKIEDVDFLSQQIDKINTLDRKQLKEYSLKILDQGTLSEKGGAGLGLIEIARKSNNRLYYSFKEINNEFSFFYMHTKIPYTAEEEHEKVEEENSLNNIIELHSILEKENVLLNFSGNFTQDTLINLLSIIENQLQGTIILKMKVFNLMVEMLQNVVKHADNYMFRDVEGKHAIFYISEDKEKITFTTGNYILNTKIERLEKQLSKINTLDKKKLSEFYNKTLFNFESNSDLHTGLGLIDIQMKSQQKLIFDFYKIDDEFSFFSLKIQVEKMKTSITPLTIEMGKDTPEIILDSEKNKFYFSGKSYPENAVSFYKPVIEWVTDYVLKPNAVTEVIFKLEYINSATEKQIARILHIFKKAEKESKIQINWQYIQGDDSMVGVANKMEHILGIKINLVEVHEDEF